MAAMLFFHDVEGALIEFTQCDIGWDEEGNVATTFEPDDTVMLTGRAQVLDEQENLLRFQALIDEEEYWVEVHLDEEGSSPKVTNPTGPQHHILSTHSQCSLMSLL